MRSHCGDPLLRLPQLRLPCLFFPRTAPAPDSSIHRRRRLQWVKGQGIPLFTDRSGNLRVYRVWYWEFYLPFSCYLLSTVVGNSVLHIMCHNQRDDFLARLVSSRSVTASILLGDPESSKGWWDISQPAASSPTYLRLAPSTSPQRFPSSQETERYKALAPVSRSSRTT